MQLATKSGIALIVLGIGIPGLWSGWRKTRNFIPVNVPISLAAGQELTAQFKLNFDGLYLIEIEAPKSVPAIEINWILSSHGRQIKAGGAKDSQIIPGESLALIRVIGEFQGKAGQDYTLQVGAASDGNGLTDTAHLRLKVAVASIAYTDLQSAGILVFSMAFICVLFGMILLAIAFHSRRKGIAGS